MKKCISLVLTVTMIASLLIVIPVTHVAAAETITDEALFMTYPTYLSNSEMDEGLAKAEEAYRAVLNSYSKNDEIVAAFMTSMSEGISIRLKEIFAKVGVGETLYETQAREAATKYLQSTLANENAAREATDKVTKAYKALKTSYSIASTIDKAQLLSDLKKLAEEHDVNVSPAGMQKVVDKLYDAGNLKVELAAIGAVSELWKYVLEFTEIHAIEMSTLQFLIGELEKAGQTNGDLYLGLTLLKSDIEKDQAEYVLDKYATSKIIEYIPKIYTFTVESSPTVSLFNVFTKFFADYIYVNAKADDIVQATMQSSFISSIDICLSKYRQKFLQGNGTTADIETYRNLYGAYLAAHKAALDTCYDIAKVEDKFGLGGDCMIWSSNIETLYTYDKYIEWCKKEAAHDIENAELDKTTGGSTITDALNEETIAGRIERIYKIYPVESGWAGDFMGTSSSLGFAARVFNYIFDKTFVSRVENDYQYILTSNVNVRLIGRLEEEGVTEAALKELFANVRIGDVVITSGQYDYLHAMTVVGMDENGPIVYDVDSKYGPAQTAEEYTHLIQKYEFPYAKMADAFSSNGKYLTKPGISVYRAIKKVNTTNSGTSLYYEEYDDSVNYVIENGILTGYKGSRTTIEIPDGVTAVAANCFYNNDSIKYVYMPDTITEIGNSAFLDCANLQSVKFSNSLEYIGDDAFVYCDSLTSIVIPGSPEIHQKAFYACHKLANIILSEDIINLENDVFNYTAWYENQPEGAVYLNKVLYKYKYIENWNCVSGGDDKSHWSHCELIGYSPLPEDVDLVIKEGTRGIAAGALSDHHDSLYLPESLECASFSSLQSLKTVYYNPIRLDCTPRFWYNVGFYYDCGATTLYIGENVEYVGYGCFSGLTSLETIYYNAKNCTDPRLPLNTCTNIVIGENVQKIPDYAFEGAQIEKIVIPDSVKEIGYRSFDGCANLKDIALPQNSIDIGDWAFANTGLEEITIPEQMTELDFSDIFPGCKNLKSITIEDGNERYYAVDGVVYDKIGNELVFIPQAIETFTIPKDVKKIDYHVFSSVDSSSGHGADCISGEVEIELDEPPSKYDNLCRINVEEGNESFISENGILYQGKSYPTLCIYPAMIESKEYTTPSNLWSIQDGAFAGNDYLEKVCIKSDNYYSISGYDNVCNGLFAECSNLKYADFRVPGKRIYSGMFYNCQNLEGIRFPEGVEEIEGLAFAGCSKLATIEIPEGVKSIGTAAFWNCKSLKSIYLPRSIEELETFALAGCESLTDIYYSGTEEEWHNVYVSTDLENVNIHYDYVTPTAEIINFTVTTKDATNAIVNLSAVNIPSDAVVYIASYNSSGKLLEIQSTALVNGSASAVFQSADIFIYKSFIWKKDSLKPLASAAEQMMGTMEITDFSVSAAGAVSLTASYIPDSARVYAASYNSQGKLLEVQTLTLENGEANAEFSTANVDSYKAFIWNKNLKPLVGLKEYKVQ